MNTKKLTGLGLLTAIVIVLQVLPALLPTGIFNVTLALVPIVVGAAIYGWQAGMWLGAVFGVVVLLTNSQVFLMVNVPGTIITVISKGLLAGLAAGLTYKAFQKNKEKKYMRLLGTIASGIVTPVVNTGVFLICCKIFFMDLINEWAAAAGFENAGTYLIVGFVGINFIIELLINVVLSSIIVRIIEYKRFMR